ncbi:P-type conjugative transfer protein TrbG [Phenylobacterium sp. LjRoot164]|uniref:P-type conjugative transfer protein TrbG n=1 Tax=unclassified Phenylobacterium TaxID=2640670 RepID=UPI003ECCCAA0
MSRNSCLAVVAAIAAFAGAPLAWAQTAPARPPATAPTSPPARAVVQAAPRPAARPAAKPAVRPASSATIGRANAQARDWPTPGAYVNSAIFYDYEPGRIYTITTSPRFLTTIALRPGEKLISKAAGDTVRWVMGETLAGSPGGEQVIIFVKPIRPDLRTNIVLTTDQRTYLIDASSVAGSAYTSVLSWNYPLDEARALAARASAEAARTSLSAPIEALDFSYRVATVKGRTPRWSPVRVFDDGAKTFIAFPAGFATMEAPPLFLLGEDGRAELVNYRVQGGYYVVDRLIERAELRLGEKSQTIVRITRLGPRA